MSSSSSSSESESDSDLDLDYQLDLSETLRHEIENEEYVCLICTNEIGIHSKIWSCRNCYRVYDLACIKQWSERGLDKQDLPQNILWKCPSCNCVYDELPDEYRCWCGKISEPFYNGLIPHSCGQTCGFKLPKCVHLCSEMCHPGPHAECTAMGPAMSCLCGKNHKQWPCIITPYETGWQCQGICGELLPCGEHRCSKPCHSGLCGACPELIPANCYCGNSSNKLIPCGSQHPQLSETLESGSWVGKYSCEVPCELQLSCGNHSCTKKCHPRHLNDHECPKKPPQSPYTEKCACGQTLVHDILGRERESCLEAIPMCDKLCPKTLRCGHQCVSKCHPGTCPPCRELVTVKCACESQLFDVPCGFQAEGLLARCSKRCNALMDCRRHRCMNVCCEHGKTALARERARKKRLRGVTLEESSLRSGSSTPDVIEQVHQCQETCNIMLNCGKHRCMFTCHSGPCYPCLESSLDDWTCPCGQTVIRAPIRCGSELKCHYSCTRQPDCGHPPVDHECHDDSVPCPKCPHVVSKQCICGKSIIKGVQCNIDNVSCGRACGKTLASCGHLCRKICHKDGDCQTVCNSLCGLVRPCNHRDTGLCHPGRTCDEACGPCKEMVTLRCVCGNRKEDTVCPGTETRPVLDCDDSCAILERNRKLAEALKLDDTVVMESQKLRGDDFHEYDDLLLDIYYADKEFGDAIERDMIAFVEKNAASYRFPNMKSDKRMFIHMLAAEYGVKSISQDTEPNRSVCLIRSENAKVPANRLKDSTNPFLKLKMR